MYEKAPPNKEESYVPCIIYISIKYIHNTPPDENQKTIYHSPPLHFLFYDYEYFQKLFHNPQDLMYNIQCNVV